MLRVSRRPGLALAATALASGTVLVISSGSAGAAAATTPKTLAGTAQGMALHLELNLPGGGGSYAEDIAFTDGKLTKTTSVTGTSTAQLFKSTGPQSQLFDNLDRKAAADV